MELIGPGLEGDVDGPAGGKARAGIERVGLNLDFRNHARGRNVGHVAAASAGVGSAVDPVFVGSGAAAVDYHR
jgi:hypothetical protein